MNEEIKEVNILKPRIDPKGKERSFYLSSEGTPKQMAKKGLIITLAMIIPSKVFGGPVGGIIDVFAAYGVALLFIALFKWIKNKRN
ncbi:MAG: hypothetical protein AAB929_06230 [Patescibacteria group bacterium]